MVSQSIHVHLAKTDTPTWSMGLINTVVKGQNVVLRLRGSRIIFRIIFLSVEVTMIYNCKCNFWTYREECENLVS